MPSSEYDEAGASRRKKVTIGLVSKMSKREATKRKAAIVAEALSQVLQAVTGNKADMLFATFYKERFLS